MNKKVPLYIMIALIVIQFCIPLSFVLYNSFEALSIDKNGEEFIIPVDTVYPIPDGLLIVKDRINRQKKYFMLENHASGYTMTQWSDTQPGNGSYIVSEIDYYGRYIFPKMTLKVDNCEYLQNYTFIKSSEGSSFRVVNNFVHYTKAEVKVKVYNGRFSVTELYIDGMPSEEFLSQLNNQ